jgi:tetratricopeptide (TPR) repeat protein
VLAHLTADFSKDDALDAEGAEEIDLQVDISVNELDEEIIEAYSNVIEEIDVAYQVASIDEDDEWMAQTQGEKPDDDHTDEDGNPLLPEALLEAADYEQDDNEDMEDLFLVDDDDDDEEDFDEVSILDHDDASYPDQDAPDSEEDLHPTGETPSFQIDHTLDREVSDLDGTSKEGPDAEPGAVPNMEKLRQLADHFKQQVDTTAYTPASDIGTVTDADIDAPSEDMEDSATSVIDITAMRARMGGSADEDSDPTFTEGDPLRVEIEQVVALELEEVEFYVAQGLVSEAHESLVELLEEYPEHPAVLSRMAAFSDDSGSSQDVASGHEGSEEQEEIPEAEILDPYEAGRGQLPALTAEDGSTHFDLGLAYREMGLLDDAIEEFQAAIEADGQAEAHFLLGQCHFDLRRLEEAVAHFESALEGAEDTLTDHIHYKLGLAFEALERPGDATFHFQKLKGHDDQFPDVAGRLQRLA